ncbi:MAG TPA: LamG-like jellyroll fold domain-containing protein [Tepidisphaeraceae bacterium]|nr:LamG-like jellyroll fold domain-containing protein [Tepidisphaeraceae bacterium]
MTHAIRPTTAVRRRFLTVLVVLLSALATSRTRAADVPKPLVDLDAAGLAPGEVQAWPNSGTLGGAFAPVAAAPTAADVAGRRAVTFAEARAFASSVPAPAEITGGQPFTVAAWVYVPEANKRGVVVSWASRPNHSAEFAYGPGPDGAFFGWDKHARFEQYPAPGAWHHIAWAYGADEMAVYVDGLLDHRRPMKLKIKAGGKVYVGCGWDSVGAKPSYPLKGSVARVQVWAGTLSHVQVRNAAGWQEAFAPAPADNVPVPAEGAVLRWQAGHAGAKAYAVRFAPDRASAADDAAPAVRVEATEFKPATALAPGRTYYWRVDQLAADGSVINKGPVWRLATDGGPAASPAPRDRVAGVPVDGLKLAWTPGRYALRQTLYFGADRTAVERGSAPAASVKLDAKAATASVQIERLAPGTVFYWRVAQDNGPAIPPAAGDVWAFRTADDPTPDEVTFFVGSDTHYGLGNNAALNRAVIDQMNWLPGAEMPAKAGGGIVNTPRGVVLTGDLLDKGFEPKTAPPAWAEFVKDYGLTGADGRLAFPVYEGFGNHDGMTGKSVSRAGIKERNPKRVGLTAISANGFHYSWDWNHVHFVQLNLFPGTDSADATVGPPNHHPENALDFLKETLAKHVAGTDKVVVVFHHYCYAGGMADWWTDAAKARAADAIKGHRAILIHGHSHGAYAYDWNGHPVISSGSTARPDSQSGDFLVVRITKTHLHVAQRKPDGWGMTLSRPLPDPVPGQTAPTAK